MRSLVGRLLGFPFGTAARLRSWAYDRGLFKVIRCGLPVVSVGNISVGGTGKTPLVVHLVERLRASGRRPGVLARGYRRRPGEELNDEGRLLARRFPDLPQVQLPDRVAGADRLIARGDVDLVLLDDAFQHRRLHRDLDLVCLDCTRPWHLDHPLPAGRLREPAAALRRADLLLLTRSDEVSPQELARLRERAHLDSGGRPLLVTSHRPRDLVDLAGNSTPLSALADRPVLVAAGIGSPRSFLRTVTDLGARVVGKRFFPDHATWSAADLSALAGQARESGAGMILCTEKDLVRSDSFPFPLQALRIDLSIVAGEELLERSLAELEKVC